MVLRPRQPSPKPTRLLSHLGRTELDEPSTERRAASGRTLLVGLGQEEVATAGAMEKRRHTARELLNAARVVEHF